MFVYRSQPQPPLSVQMRDYCSTQACRVPRSWDSVLQCRYRTVPEASPLLFSSRAYVHGRFVSACFTGSCSQKQKGTVACVDGRCCDTKVVLTQNADRGEVSSEVTQML